MTEICKRTRLVWRRILCWVDEMKILFTPQTKDEIDRSPLYPHLV